MKKNLDRMLEKLDLILKLVRDCNSTLKRIESRGESRHISSILTDDVTESEIIGEPEADSEIVDELDSEPEAEESLI